MGGAARLAEAASREKLEQAGIRPCQVDFAGDDLSALPDDFTYLLHFAYTRGGLGDFDHALRINGEGTGFVMRHCQSAKAVLIVSSAAIYSTPEEHSHLLREGDAIGGAFAAFSPTSPISKVAEESVARFCARAFGLPTTIARLGTVYGRPENLSSMHIRAILAGEAAVVDWDPFFHTPIHVDDMCAQIEQLLKAASIPATIVNWAGDEVVSAQQWCELAGKLLGKSVQYDVIAAPGGYRTSAADTTRRKALTGPCKVRFEDGMRRLIDAYHGGVRG